MTELTLAELNIGEACTIQSIEIQGDIKQRLLDLGFVPGDCVTCEHIAPSGSPKAFWIKGALIALRLSDCCHIKGVLDGE